MHPCIHTYIHTFTFTFTFTSTFTFTFTYIYIDICTFCGNTASPCVASLKLNMSRVSTGPVAAYDALVGWPRENEGRMKELIQQKWGIQVATKDLNQQTWGIQYGYSKSDRKGWKVLKLAFFLVFTTKICVFWVQKRDPEKTECSTANGDMLCHPAWGWIRICLYKNGTLGLQTT